MFSTPVVAPYGESFFREVAASAVFLENLRLQLFYRTAHTGCARTFASFVDDERRACFVDQSNLLHITMA